MIDYKETRMQKERRRDDSLSRRIDRPPYEAGLFLNKAKEMSRGDTP